MAQSQAEMAFCAIAGGSGTLAGGTPQGLGQDNLPLLNALLPRTPQRSFAESKINQGAAMFSDAPISPTGFLGVTVTVPIVEGTLPVALPRRSMMWCAS